MSDEDRRTAEAMIQHGGSFVKALGEAALKADDLNLSIIKSSFAVYWAHFAKIGERADELMQN